jgi:hypothetical protein
MATNGGVIVTAAGEFECKQQKKRENNGLTDKVATEAMLRQQQNGSCATQWLSQWQQEAAAATPVCKRQRQRWG